MVWRHVIGGLVACALVVSIAAACNTKDSSTFRCGEKREEGTVTQCDEPGQICVCDSRKCAERTPGCPSGFRYVDWPFAPPGRINDCVRPDEVDGGTVKGSSAGTCDGEGSGNASSSNDAATVDGGGTQ